MGSRTSVQIGNPTTEDDDLEFELTGYCGRPSCRRAFPQTSGRGRRREFCSDTCRRGADKEYKRAKAMVAHFEELLQRSRYDVASFGRSGDEDTVRVPDDAIRIAANAFAAVQRAQGILHFASGGDERLLNELRSLVSAVAPLVRPPGA